MAAPVGNKNASKGTHFRIALNKEIEEYCNKRKGISRGEALRNIAHALITQAIDGDLNSIKEIADRLDGKATQQVIAEIDTQHSYVVRLPEIPEDAVEWATTYKPPSKLDS